MAKRRTVLTFYLWLSLSLEDVFSGYLFKIFFCICNFAGQILKPGILMGS